VALWLALALALGAWAVGFLFEGASLSGIAVAIRRQPAWEIAAALALTAVSFACLASYDAIGVEVVAKGRVPRRVALLAGATGSAIANTVGFHAVTGTAVRAHIYLPAGLGGTEVARIVSLSWLSLSAGNLTMFAVAELFQAAAAPHPAVHLATGLALVAVLALLLAWLARSPREIAIRGYRFPMPSASLAMAQMLIGAIESATAIGALYVLLPTDLAPPFSIFAVGCIAAVALGVVAHTPGGIGVFEASLTAMLSGRGRADLLAALLLYRMVYNLVPFMLSVSTLGLLAASNRIRRARKTP
jgi:uncharacterized membrane protein YbhN (UPF0104 family)